MVTLPLLTETVFAALEAFSVVVTAPPEEPLVRQMYRPPGVAKVPAAALNVNAEASTAVVAAMVLSEIVTLM